MFIRLKSDNGGTVSGIFNSNNDYPIILQNYFIGSKICKSTKNADICWHSKWYTYNNHLISSNENDFSSLVLADGTILMFWHGSNDCTSSAELKTNTGCARIRVDTNGDKKPNKVGKDIFDFYMLQDKIIARGDPLSTATIDDIGGWGMGYKILTQNKIE